MTFQKVSDICPIANWAQLINTIGTIQTDPNGLVLTPVYLAFKLFRDHMYNNLVEDVHVECETFNTLKFGRIPRMENVPYIDCNANSNDESDELSIMLVNKHFTDKLNVNLEVKGFIPSNQGILEEMSSESPFDYNTVENRDKIQVIEKDIENVEPNMTIELAEHSVTILKLRKK